MKLSNKQISILRTILLEASQAIMKVYKSEDFDISKKDDETPLTRADHASHEIITQGLQYFFSTIPIMSEEGEIPSYEERKKWKRFWCVDPLDGTKEFIKKTGEFSVSLALIEDGRTVFGIIAEPTTEMIYWGGKEYGAWKQQGEKKPTELTRERSGRKNKKQDMLRVMGSRSHASKADKAFIDLLEKKGYQLDVEAIGSALKFCRLADSKADCYPRFRPSMWRDSAGGQAIVEACGFSVIPVENYETITMTDAGDFPTLHYEGEELCNPGFVVIESEIYKKLF